MNILIVDPTCPKPYDSESLKTTPMGGTEATVIRVANALAALGLPVTVKQHNRKGVTKDVVTYVPFGHETERPTHVIVLRAPLALLTARKQFPNAKIYLWCHDLFGGDGWDRGFQAIIDTNTIPVVVSDFHRMQMYEAMRSINFKGSIPCRKVYNPIAEDLRPDGTPVDPDKLVFFSSPHKGLARTLEVVQRFKDFPELKDTKLYIANPGYIPDFPLDGLSNVVNLGPLTHPEVIQHVRSSLAVLHLNNVFPETFGLVHIEANAVGTPFLSSRIGATPELCDHPAELIDVMDNKAVIDRLISWKTRGRPKVRGYAGFRMSAIIKEWLDVFKF